MLPEDSGHTTRDKRSRSPDRFTRSPRDFVLPTSDEAAPGIGLRDYTLAVAPLPDTHPSIEYHRNVRLTRTVEPRG